MKRWLDAYEELGETPRQGPLRATLKDLATAASPQAQQEGIPRLAGFQGNAIISLVEQRRKNAEELEQQISTLKRRLASCQSLADEYGVDIFEIKRLAHTSLDTLDEDKERRVRAIMDAYREQVGPSQAATRKRPPTLPAEAAVQPVTVAAQADPEPASIVTALEATRTTSQPPGVPSPQPKPPQSKRPKPEPKAEPCLPALSENTIEALQVELASQKSDLEKAQRSKGNTGGLPKIVRVNLAERAVGKVERKIRAEEKRLAACVVSTGARMPATARTPAVAKTTRPKGRTKKRHPMAELRRAVQSAQRRGR